jgi:PEP-CTERM motif
MKRTILILGSLALLLGGVRQADAGIVGSSSSAGVENPNYGVDPLFSFSYSDGTNSANALLTTISIGTNKFLATSGTLNVTAGGAKGTYSLFAGGPGQTTSPLDSFYYDDVIYQGSNPFLDIDGLLFVGHGLEINIWGNAPGNYSFFTSNTTQQYPIQVTVANSPASLTAVPEPATLTMLGFGIAGLAGYGWRRRKQPVANA